MSVPQSDQLTDQGQMMDFGIAFELLSKPTLEMSDDDLLKVAQDLRAKRIKFLQGQADRPGATARISKPKPTAEEKAARTEHLKQQLNLGNLEI